MGIFPLLEGSGQTLLLAARWFDRAAGGRPDIPGWPQVGLSAAEPRNDGAAGRVPDLPAFCPGQQD